MNFYILRITLVLIVGLIIFLLNKFILKKSLKDIRLISVSAVIILAIVVLPYDKVFFKFDSIEKLFNYYYPYVDLLEKYEYKDYAYALYHYDNTYNFVHLRKDNNNWLLNNDVFAQSRGKVENGYIFSINEIKDKKVIGIFILTLGEKIDVKDSLGTKFKEIERDDSIYYIGIIEDNYDDNYKLMVNDKEYDIFK